jgi:hypothetical protein
MVSKVAGDGGITKAQAERAVASMVAAIADAQVGWGQGGIGGVWNLQRW